MFLANSISYFSYFIVSIISLVYLLVFIIIGIKLRFVNIKVVFYFIKLTILAKMRIKS